MVRLRCENCGQFREEKHKCPNRLFGRALELKQNRHRLTDESKKLTPNLGYIMGVIFGDGWITRKTIYLRVIDEDFAMSFAKSCFEQFNKKPHIYERTYRWINHRIKGKLVKKDKTEFFEVALCSVEASEFLKNLMENIFDIVPKQNDEFIKEFIKGVFDSEGSHMNKFGKHRRVQIRMSKNLEFIKSLLVKIDFPEEHIRLYPERLILNCRYADMFMQIIGTNISRKLELPLSP